MLESGNETGQTCRLVIGFGLQECFIDMYIGLLVCVCVSSSISCFASLSFLPSCESLILEGDDTGFVWLHHESASTREHETIAGHISR